MNSRLIIEVFWTLIFFFSLPCVNCWQSFMRQLPLFSFPLMPLLCLLWALHYAALVWNFTCKIKFWPSISISYSNNWDFYDIVVVFFSIMCQLLDNHFPVNCFFLLSTNAPFMPFPVVTLCCLCMEFYLQNKILGITLICKIKFITTI